MSFINLLIDQHDEGYLPYNEIANLQKIKEGWRLPTKDELNYIFNNRGKIGGFAETIINQDGIIKYPVYWSSTIEYKGQCIQSFGKDEHAGFQGHNFNSENSFYVRLVKIKRSLDIIGTPIKINNIEVAQYDFPQEVNWDEANKVCNELSNGWRLPTKDELNILYQNKDFIGGFFNTSYWGTNSKRSYLTDDNISDVLEGKRDWDDFNIIEPIQFSFNLQELTSNLISKCKVRAVKDIID